MATIEFNDGVAERFNVFAQAHHDGNNNAALDDLLLCHKVLVAKLMSEAKKYDIPK